MPPELSPFSDSNICWDKIRLGEHKAMQIEVTSSELEEEIKKPSTFQTGGSKNMHS